MTPKFELGRDFCTMHSALYKNLVRVRIWGSQPPGCVPPTMWRWARTLGKSPQAVQFTHGYWPPFTVTYSSHEAGPPPIVTRQLHKCIDTSLAKCLRSVNVTGIFYSVRRSNWVAAILRERFYMYTSLMRSFARRTEAGGFDFIICVRNTKYKVFASVNCC